MELSIDIILAALNEDEEALLVVLQHYERYINAFAYEKYTDEKGNTRVRLDPDVKQQLRLKLLTAVQRFDVKRGLEE